MKIYDVRIWFNRIQLTEATVVKETPIFYILDKYVGYSKRIEKHGAHLTWDEAFNFTENDIASKIRIYEKHIKDEQEDLKIVQKARAQNQHTTGTMPVPGTSPVTQTGVPASA